MNGLHVPEMVAGSPAGDPISAAERSAQPTNGLAVLANGQPAAPQQPISDAEAFAAEFERALSLPTPVADSSAAAAAQTPSGGASAEHGRPAADGAKASGADGAAAGGLPPADAVASPDAAAPQQPAAQPEHGAAPAPAAEAQQDGAGAQPAASQQQPEPSGQPAAPQCSSPAEGGDAAAQGKDTHAQEPQRQPAQQPQADQPPTDAAPTEQEPAQPPAEQPEQPKAPQLQFGTLPADVAAAVANLDTAAPAAASQSKLNPAAREFTFNPAAKEFQPRPVSAPAVSWADRVKRSPAEAPKPGRCLFLSSVPFNQLLSISSFQLAAHHCAKLVGIVLVVSHGDAGSWAGSLICGLHARASCLRSWRRDRAICTTPAQQLVV